MMGGFTLDKLAQALRGMPRAWHLGNDAETWLRLQMAYDIVQARQREKAIDVKPASRRKLHAPRP